MIFPCAATGGFRSPGLWPLAGWLLALLGCATVSAGELNYEGLRSQIRSAQVHRISELIELLPAPLRSHYALMFESRSLQQASFENPRVILYGTDARFIVTFNGQPAQHGYDALEVAEFRDETQSFELHEIRFPEDAGGEVEYSAANPPQCLACHGAPARALWDSGPLWPGAYGERYREPLSAPEKAGIARFLQQQSGHSRYRALLGVERFGTRDLYAPGARSQYDGSDGEPPNAEFARLLGALNARRLVAQLSAQPQFAAWQYALLGAAEGDCGALPEFLPEAARTRAAAALVQYEREAQEANTRAAQLGRARLVSLAELPVGADGRHAEALTALRYLAEAALGLSTRDWSTALEQGSYDFSVPGQSGRAAAELLRAGLLPADSRLGDLAGARNHTPEDAYCRYLQRRSQHALEAVARTMVWKSTPLPAPSAAERLQDCARCHAHQIGPELPLADPRALAGRLHETGYPRGDLLDEIEYRLAPQAGVAHMPLNDNLDESARRSVSVYLEELARTP